MNRFALLPGIDQPPVPADGAQSGKAVRDAPYRKNIANWLRDRGSPMFMVMVVRSSDEGWFGDLS
ncbi:MAG TPA: hypothetical protein VGU01_09470 [Sphingomicrobium sp.]|nr:hypothetical protein [Sphingomicrobium sp.]